MMMISIIIIGLEYNYMVVFLFSLSLWQIGGPRYGQYARVGRGQEGIKTTGGFFQG